MSYRAVRRLRWAVLLGGLVPALLLACTLGASSEEFGEFPGWFAPSVTCLDDLKDLEMEQLQQVFAMGWPSTPSGLGRGEVLMLANTRHARMRARMANAVWKGKYFEDDGTFINQWCGFRALHSSAAEGCSWFDGRPCIVLEYPPGTPLFANMRDEIREVAPGLWLGMFFEREPCPKFRGFFALECAPEKHGRFHR
jgi:hypothetical protein